jgi:DNA-binding transcriptional MerR regulator
MRRYAELVRQGPQTVDERRELLEAHRDNVLAQIARLQQDLTAVNFKIAKYSTRD